MIETATNRSSQDSAACQLKEPVNDLADAIVFNQKNTPDDIIIKGTTVIKGFDGLGC